MVMFMSVYYLYTFYFSTFTHALPLCTHKVDFTLWDSFFTHPLEEYTFDIHKTKLVNMQDI